MPAKVAVVAVAVSGGSIRSKARQEEALPAAGWKIWAGVQQQAQTLHSGTRPSLPGGVCGSLRCAATQTCQPGALHTHVTAVEVWTEPWTLCETSGTKAGTGRLTISSTPFREAALLLKSLFSFWISTSALPACRICQTTYHLHLTFASRICARVVRYAPLSSPCSLSTLSFLVA